MSGATDGATTTNTVTEQTRFRAFSDHYCRVVLIFQDTTCSAKGCLEWTVLGMRKLVQFVVGG